MSLRGSAGVRRNRYRMLLKKRLVVAAQPISTLQMKLENVLCKVAVVYSNDSSMQQEAIILIRKLLCLEGSGLPIEEVLQYGAAPLFFGFFLTREDWIQIQIATGVNSLSIVFLNRHVFPAFLKLLATLQRGFGRDQTVSWLGSLVGWYRDRILTHMSLLKKDAQLLMLRNDTLTLLNFCQAKPTFDLLLTKEAVFGVLEGLVVDSSDEEVLTNTCCALLYLSADAKALIEAGFCQRLVQLLQHPSPCVVIPALLTVANIVTRIDVQIHQVNKAGLIAPLVKLLELDIKKATLLNLLELDIEKEFGLAISKPNEEQIKLLVKRGCIKPLCDLLSSRDPTVVSVCLQGLEKVGEALEDNNFAHLIDEARGFDKIENLLSHHNHEISLKAVKIVKATNLKIVRVSKIEAPVDPTKEVSRLVYERKYEEAFIAALQRRDVRIVSWLCSKVDLQEILTSDPIRLSQGVLLSLLQQLGCDIGNDTSQKLGWMMDIVVAIKPSDGIIAKHVRPIFEQVYSILYHQLSVPVTSVAEVASIRVVMTLVNLNLTNVFVTGSDRPVGPENRYNTGPTLAGQLPKNKLD